MRVLVLQRRKLRILIGLVLLASSLVAAVSSYGQDSAPSPAELNDATRLADRQHLQRVASHLRLSVFEELAADSMLRTYDNQWHLAKSRAALKLFTDQTVRDFWLREIMIDQIESYGVKNIQPLLDLFYAHCQDSSKRREVRESYERDSTDYFSNEIVSYKRAGPFRLDAVVFKPEGWSPADRRPAILFFHGGSWYQGTPAWMFGFCRSYAKLGVVTIAVEYRLYDRHGVSPIECMLDAKSAVRYFRVHAVEYGIDPDKIAACGASAGGHLALCAATLDSLNEPGEDTSVSAAPNALVLYYTCFDPTLDSWFVKQVSPRLPATACSPSHNVRPGLPPTLAIHGTNDYNCPYYTAKEYCDKATAAGNRCELYSLPGAGHFFIFDPKFRSEAGKEMRRFLASLGYVAPTSE